MYWTDTPDGHRCTRHDHEFRRGEVCHECVTDPGDAPGHAVETTEYQRQLRARVSEYQSRARTCWRKVAEIDEDGTAREENVAVKWSAEAVKWSRLAEEMQKHLDDRDHELTLLRHEREMSGQRRGN